MFRKIETPLQFPTKLCLFGVQGTGKSYAIAQRTKGRRRVIIDAESGFKRYLAPGDLYAELTSDKPGKEAIEHITQALAMRDIDDIIVDGATTIGTLLAYEDTIPRKTKAGGIVIQPTATKAPATIERVCQALVRSPANVWITSRAIEVRNFGKPTGEVIIDGSQAWAYMMDTVVLVKIGQDGKREYVTTKKRTGIEEKPCPCPVCGKV